MKANNILETIGNTPHVRINKLFGASHEVWIKLERTNQGSSHKTRIALNMIEDAEKRQINKILLNLQERLPVRKESLLEFRLELPWQQLLKR